MSAIDTRGVSRDSLFLMADISVEGREAERVKVRNLSDTGMLGEGSISVAKGKLVTVELRNIGTVDGTVAWTRGVRFGVAFDRMIDSKRARVPLGDGSERAPIYARPAVYPDPEPIHPSRLRKI